MCGGEGTRTPGLLRAREALYQAELHPLELLKLTADPDGRDEPAPAEENTIVVLRSSGGHPSAQLVLTGASGASPALARGTRTTAGPAPRAASASAISQANSVAAAAGLSRPASWPRQPHSRPPSKTTWWSGASSWSKTIRARSGTALGSGTTLGRLEPLPHASPPHASPPGSDGDRTRLPNVRYPDDG